MDDFFKVSRFKECFLDWCCLGLAATHGSWVPQIRALAGTLTPNDEKSTAGDGSSDDVDYESSGIEVCVFDNRGMGLSSVPTKRAAYTWVSFAFLVSVSMHKYNA